jgi:hypothetical protein
VSQPELGDQPDPRVDNAPDPAPGGPADRVVDDAGPEPVIPDPPRSAQVKDTAVPDEIGEPEHMDEDEQTAEPGDEPTD